MEKKIWSKPEMHEFVFAANEYVAACGDQNRVFKFVCDAVAGPLYYYKNWLVSVVNGVTNKPTNLPGSLYGWNSDEAGNNEAGTELLGVLYHPCGETHEASVTDEFYWGFVDYNANARNDGDDETVIVWRGDKGNNGHATKDLNMNEWETAKS